MRSRHRRARAPAQAFTSYEEDISDSKAQFAAVTLASATLHHCGSFGADAYDTLATKTTQYSARLLKKPDQCRAVTRAAMLFTSKGGGEGGAEGGAEGGGADGKRVLECLQRSLKLADACKVSGMHTPLFVEILDVYLYHYHAKCAAVLPSYISSLMQLVEQQLTDDAVADDAKLAQARAHFGASKAYVAAKRLTDERFAEIEIAE